MKSKISIVCAALFALSMTACSNNTVKSEDTQVPEMTTAMPAEITTATPEPAPEAVKAKPAGKKKSKKKAKPAANTDA